MLGVMTDHGQARGVPVDIRRRGEHAIRMQGRGRRQERCPWPESTACCGELTGAFSTGSVSLALASKASSSFGGSRPGRARTDLASQLRAPSARSLRTKLQQTHLRPRVGVEVASQERAAGLGPTAAPHLTGPKSYGRPCRMYDQVCHRPARARMQPCEGPLYTQSLLATLQQVFRPIRLPMPQLDSRTHLATS